MDGMAGCMPEQVPEQVRVAIETWADEPDLPLVPGVKTKGGVTVLQTQAANPMWAFFQHRLSVRGLPAHALWPATFDRGFFLHRVLELLWEAWGSQARMLEQIAKPDWPEELRAVIARVGADKLAQWPAILRELEQQRGFEVVNNLLTFEAQRPPFKVVEREVQHDFIEGPLTLRLTIDRIDELATGQRIVFDYKSGSTVPRPEADWQSIALRQAQLLVYASVLVQEGRAPDGLGWIGLNVSGAEVKGLSGDDLNLPGIALLAEQKWAECDWPEQLMRWDNRVRKLAQEFAAGVHDNRCWRADDMKFCSIKPLLRLHAQADDE